MHRPDRPLRILTIDDTLDGEDVVPGWKLPIRDLFGEALAQRPTHAFDCPTVE